MKNKTIENIQNLEKQYFPIKEILENSEKYKGLYKGLISIQSKIANNPDILFLGINPGEGAYIEINQKSKKNKFPERLISNNDYLSSIELDWLKKGVSRGEKIKGNWFAYEWYERDKKINNSFPSRMIDLLYFLGESKLGKGLDSKSEIFTKKFNEEITDKIVYTNINPIATKSTTELEKIITLLSKEESLKNHWKPDKQNRITKSIVKNFFRQRTFDLINILKPKVIVCLGNTVYSELTYRKIGNKSKVFTSKYNVRNIEYNMVTFSRSGTWSPLLKEVSIQINNTLSDKS
jgi:hypothetical protein